MDNKSLQTLQNHNAKLQLRTTANCLDVPVVRGILRAVMVMKCHAFAFGRPGTRLVPSHRRSTTHASFQVGRRFLSTMTETKQQPAGISLGTRGDWSCAPPPSLKSKAPKLINPRQAGRLLWQSGHIWLVADSDFHDWQELKKWKNSEDSSTR
jgi:hypothetical protein